MAAIRHSPVQTVVLRVTSKFVEERHCLDVGGRRGKGPESIGDGDLEMHRAAGTLGKIDPLCQIKGERQGCRDNARAAGSKVDRSIAAGEVAVHVSS